MFNLQQKAERVNLKEVSIHPPFTADPDRPTLSVFDRQALSPSFSQLLSQQLYGQPQLRPSVLKALKVVVDSNVSPSLTDVIMPDLAAKNAALLRTQAETWLAVLFNVFGSVGRVGDVISAWAAIAGEQVHSPYVGYSRVCILLTKMQEITKTHHKVVDLFKQNLAKSPAPLANNGPDDNGSVTAMTQDILILLLPYLSSTDATALFQMCLSSNTLGNKDNSVPKRGYKILAKLVESGKVTVGAETVLGQLDEFAEGLAPAAKKVKML
jgi:ribosomal RNA-processing protein 12